MSFNIHQIYMHVLRIVSKVKFKNAIRIYTQIIYIFNY